MILAAPGLNENIETTITPTKEEGVLIEKEVDNEQF